MRRLKTRRRTSKRKSFKRKSFKRKTFKRKYMGGHEHEDLEHYHLNVKDANTGRTIEIPEVFKVGKRSRNVTSADVKEVKIYAAERFYLNPDEIFLSWKGFKLEPDQLKLRDIEVNGEKIRLYQPDTENPIIVHTIGKEYERYPITGTVMPVSSGYETDDS
jgi:hypothetical protein